MKISQLWDCSSSQWDLKYGVHAGTPPGKPWRPPGPIPPGAAPLCSRATPGKGGGGPSRWCPPAPHRSPLAIQGPLGRRRPSPCRTTGTRSARGQQPRNLVRALGSCANEIMQTTITRCFQNIVLLGTGGKAITETSVKKPLINPDRGNTDLANWFFNFIFF